MNYLSLNFRQPKQLSLLKYGGITPSLLQPNFVEKLDKHIEKASLNLVSLIWLYECLDYIKDNLEKIDVEVLRVFFFCVCCEKDYIEAESILNFCRDAFPDKATAYIVSATFYLKHHNYKMAKIMLDQVKGKKIRSLDKDLLNTLKKDFYYETDGELLPDFYRYEDEINACVDDIERSSDKFFNLVKIFNGKIIDDVTHYELVKGV